MRIFFTLCVIAAIAPLSCASHAAQNPLIGAWSLAALEEPTPDGQRRRADCTGQLQFSSDGHMAVQVMYRDPQASAGAYARSGYEASFGRYAVDAAADSFTFHVDGALVRELVGQELRRHFTWSDGKLVITSVNADEHWRVVWERSAEVPAK